MADEIEVIVDDHKLTKELTPPPIVTTHGRRRITIPLTKDQLTNETIIQYLDHVLHVHSLNAVEMIGLHNYVNGDQPILNKVRPTQDGNSNSIVMENHASFMMKFKKGFMYGADLLYSISDDTCQKAVSLLNKYLKDAHKNTLDEMKAHDVYSGGMANRLILPRKGKFNVQKQAPFTLYNLDYDSSFVVYSSCYTKEKLFGGIISCIGKDEYELVIYTHDMAYYYDLDKSMNHFTVRRLKYMIPHHIGLCPIVQYYCDPSYMSPIETVAPILDSLNSVSSNCLDSIIDYVNSILLIKNARIPDGKLSEIKKNGAMELLTNDPNKPATAEFLANPLNMADVQQRYESLLKAAYDIAGVPRPSGNVTSGGDTGQARLLGGGWECAEIVGDDEEKCLRIGETEELEIILQICRKTSNCPITELFTSDIEVKFTRNKSDNLLVKAQALKYFYDMGMPYEIGLTLSNITSTPHEVATVWETNFKHQNIANTPLVPNKEISDSE